MISTRWTRFFFVLVAFGFALVSCAASRQRTSHSSLKADAVMGRLDEITGGDTEVSAEVTKVMQMRSNAKIYYAESPGDFGPVGSLLSFSDWTFLGLDPSSTAGLGYKTIKAARIVMFDHVDDPAQHTIGLVLGLSQGGDFTYYAFSGAARLGENVLEADLTGDQRAVTMQTSDVKNGVLNKTIQLKMFSKSQYIGKISTLLNYRN